MTRLENKKIILSDHYYIITSKSVFNGVGSGRVTQFCVSWTLRSAFIWYVNDSWCWCTVPIREYISATTVWIQHDIKSRFQRRTDRYNKCDKHSENRFQFVVNSILDQFSHQKNNFNCGVSRSQIDFATSSNLFSYFLWHHYDRSVRWT